MPAFSSLARRLGVLSLMVLVAMPAFGATTAPGSLIGYDSNFHGSTHVRCVLSPLEISFTNMGPGHARGYYKMNMVADNSPGPKGHIQGAARLYVGSSQPYFALSRSTGWPTALPSPGPGGGVHVGRYYGGIGPNGDWTAGTTAWPTQDSKRIFEDPGGDVIYNANPYCPHPGGLSAIGNYMVTGWDANEGFGCPSKSVEIYNVGTPTNIFRTKKLDNTEGSANVAVVRLDDPILGQKFLLGAGGRDMKTVEFFLCDNLDGGSCTSTNTWVEDDTTTNHGTCWNWWSGDELTTNQYFSGIQFAVECGSGQVYLVGTNERGSNNEAHLYKVTYSGGKFHFQKICVQALFSETHGINFDGGASIHVDPTGRMQMYASGKCEANIFGSDGCTSWNDTVIGQFWNDASIAYWTLDNTASDASGYDNHGTPVNGAAYTSGVFSNAILLDGVNDYVRINTHQTFNGMSRFTLSALIYPTQLNTHNTILAKVNPSRDFVLKLTGTGQINAHFYDGGYRHCTSDVTVPLNTWSLVAAEWTGTHWKLYLNGGLVKTCDHNGYAPPWTGTRMGIGTMNWTEFFTGKIDEVEIR